MYIYFYFKWLLRKLYFHWGFPGPILPAISWKICWIQFYHPTSKIINLFIIPWNLIKSIFIIRLFINNNTKHIFFDFFEIFNLLLPILFVIVIYILYILPIGDPIRILFPSLQSNINYYLQLICREIIILLAFFGGGEKGRVTSKISPAP